MLNISKIKIKKIIPNEGHVGFASCVIDDWLFLANIAIFTRLNQDNIRLVFPEKKINNRRISLFYPLDSNSYFELENIIFDKYKEL